MNGNRKNEPLCPFGTRSALGICLQKPVLRGKRRSSERFCPLSPEMEGSLLEENLTLAKYLEDANMNYMTGAYTHLWKSWRYDNVMPGYDKLYYIVDGEFYLKINDQEYTAKKGQVFLLPFNSNQTYYHTTDNLATKYWAHFTMPCKNKDLLTLVDLPHYIQV